MMLGLFLLKVFLPALVALLITSAALPCWMAVCRKWKIYDKAEESRKHHAANIPSIGGIAIFIGFVASFFLFNDTGVSTFVKFFCVACVLLFYTGFFDDLLNISALKKLLMQLAAALLIVVSGLKITTLMGLFGVYEISTIPSFIITTFFIVALTNAYNLIDGIDGLASSMGILVLTIFGSIFFTFELYLFAVLAFSFSGALLGFLIYNVHPARIFMGDSGSLLIGFVISVLTIKLTTLYQTGTASAMLINPTFITAVLFIPCYDMFRVFVIRAVLRKNPLEADRNHLHHMITRQGLGHNGATIILGTFNIVLIAIQQIWISVNPYLFVLIAVLFAMSVLNSRVIGLIAHVRNKALAAKGEHANV
ncbi:MAG: undecaprenyl/decaprenyl-phosphate alpha-N-acetylglucosaminyl 1-phosphate transferase [Bacteroidia bacterium]|nr:undecaprenyl/decaprenyl-phosphate alpha-N-acetylglucosaminyl 1-phosphate transferase [Bacteroidia bacterium]NNC85379.1 undecaprenyl/decaprenyl-phosphate alpha-N-acetylglucosaminyl 1-phosphate transferase [Bacteroidia bacterium]NNM16825.1 undecaprenyl/decaprenyl-phosphate alpha-N-acetylglucosaminyl 1-phosphate transferase [Bacteroidia bacterium]